MLNNKLNSLIRGSLHKWMRSVSFFIFCFHLFSCVSEVDDPHNGNEENNEVELYIDAGDTNVDGGDTNVDSSDSYLVDEKFRLLLPGTNIIRIGDAYKHCQEDTDCVLVGPDCYSCCTLNVINRDLIEIYEQQIEEICADYVPPYACSCVMPNSIARCQNNTCTEVLIETSSN